MKNTNKSYTLVAPCTGEVIKLENVKDEVFSQGILGTGFAIVPDTKDFLSPINGKVANSHESGHAYMIEGDNGLEILVHIGIDTVELEGEYFTPFVKSNMRLSQGDRLAYADVDKISSRGYDPVCIVVVTNSEKLKSIEIKYGKIMAGQEVMTYTL